MFSGIVTTWQHLRDKQRQKKAVEEFEHEMLGIPLFIMIIALAGCIASLGLLRANQAVVIGAMIITPLVSPFVGISLALVMRKKNLFFHSLNRAILGAILLFLIAFAFGSFLSIGKESFLLFQIEEIGIPEVLIAVCAGIVAALALASEKIYNLVSGAAIALSLAPPLAMSGILFASGGESQAFINAITLFGINAVGLVVMSFVVFLCFGYHRSNSNHETSLPID